MSSATVSTAPTVVSVRPDSVAAAAGLQVGDEIVRVNGDIPRDIIEWSLAIDGPEVSLDVRRGASVLEVEIAKADGEPLGLDIESAVFDRVRTCDNHCEFCFIHQLPPGMRRSLYLKDDDYRLSFLYGNFTTLTRFTEADLERVITERLSPLNVSIHSTDHDLRIRMLRNQRGGMSLRWLAALLEYGIEVRAQVVVCPGVNDGDALERTLAGILDRFGDITSVAVVPLGISRFNREAAMRAHTIDEARDVVRIVEEWQGVYGSVRGRPTVYAADEYYLMADLPFPDRAVYGEFPMHEDGVGMARAFEAEFTGASTTPIGPRPGFFAAVDLPVNPAAYTGLRSRPSQGAVTVSPVPGASSVRLRPSKRAPVAILTGELGARVIEPLVATLGRDDVRVLPVPNRYFGGTTAVTGLLTGPDLAAVLEREPEGHRYLLPDVCLSDEGIFLDGSSVAELPRPVEVLATDGTSLRRALEERR